MSSELSTTKTRRHLIWLDNNINSRSNQKTLTKLANIDPSIRGFDDPNDCLHYIKSYRKNGGQLAILLVISGGLSETAIPQIHDYPWISGIYIYCRNPRRFDHLHFAKLRDIHDDTDDLLEQLRLDAERDEVSMDYHFFSERTKQDDDHPLRNLKEEQTRFVWFYKWYQFMIDLKVSENDEEAKAEMVQFCRNTFAQKSSEIRVIDQFENESFQSKENAAIKWYTKSACMFRWINQALFQSDITQIYRFRFMIRLICHQLKELDGNYRNLSDTSILRLYRGSALKLSKITEMSNHLGDLICVNSFLSTSTDKETAIGFSHVRRSEGLESVLFVIDVDLDHSQNIAMANIRDISHFKDEEEVLISVGAIFSIQSVKYDSEKDLHTVHLTLGDSEQLTVNKYVEETYKNDAALSDRAILFGKLLFEMGELTLAIEYLRKCLKNLSDDDNHKRPIYLNNIAVCYNALGDKQQALIFYNQALRIFEKNPGNRAERDYYQNELGACYHNIASYYFGLKEYSTAYPMAIDALSKRQNFPLGRASTLDLLGRLQLVNRDYDAAQDSFRQSLQLRLKYLGQTNPNHPDIGISHENMGQLCFRKHQYEESLRQFERAAEIYRHNFEKTHLRVVTIEDGISKLQELMNNN